MGCISVRKIKSTTLTRSETHFSTSLAQTRDNFLSRIINLHSLGLKCKKGIENSIRQKNRQVAVLLKLKQIYIDSKLHELREMIAQVDFCIENLSECQKSKKAIMKLINEENQELTHVLLKDDVDLLLTNSKDYIESIKKEIGKLHLDEKSAEIEIEHLLQVSFVESASEGTFKRRKYSRIERNLTY
ncbi:hypothetical protein SteCoe_34526 [Stentor coeruleus]|uniref:Uncharacterized protein n=1 Tax=Stentor coeruleus TaxID=5963 RepID=A0A1R2AUC0_9CILI|nr:hypothetical protein SteCoe_34526 [Stentor coeruleus]